MCGLVSTVLILSDSKYGMLSLTFWALRKRKNRMYASEAYRIVLVDQLFKVNKKKEANVEELIYNITLVWILYALRVSSHHVKCVFHS